MAKGILISLFGAGALALGILWATSTAAMDPSSPPSVLGRTPRLAPEPGAPQAAGSTIERVPRPRIVPVRVSLDLVRAAALDGTASDPPLGSNRTAGLAGQLIGTTGEPIVGEVQFRAGPNPGRAARTDAHGRFTLVDLHPGLSLIEVLASGRCHARREVRLAAAGEARFHLALAQPARVAGRVVDADGAGLAGASVRIDGGALRTDAAGAFAATAVASGGVLVEVTAEGYAATRRRVNVAPAQEIDTLRITLRREARLQINLRGEDRRPARVWLLPAVHAHADDTPWDRFADLALGRKPLELTGLPPGPVRLYVHRTGAKLVGGARDLELVAGARIEASVELAATTVIEGRALSGGRAVAGAHVELLAPDPLARSAAVMLLPTTCFDARVLSLLPPARERATSDRDGTFLLTGGDTGSPWRELRVASGSRAAVRAIWQGETHAEVELAPKPGNVGRLVLDFGPRTAELAVDVFVQGEPLQTRQLSPEAPLVLDDLRRGVWRAQVSTGVVDLLQLPALHLGAEGHCQVALPLEVVPRSP